MSFFVIGLLCMSRKNAFIANQKISLAESFTNFTQSRFFTHKNFFCTCLSSLSANNSHFHKSKAFLLYKPSLIVTQSTPFPPSAFHSHPAITYCPPKNTAVLLISALTPYAVTPEHRTDSNHCRRYPETCSFQHSRLPDERRSLSQKHRIDRRFESWVAGLRPACFLVTFCTTQKVTIRSPLQKVPRFSKPQISAPQ